MESIRGEGTTFKLTLMLPSYSGDAYQPAEPAVITGYPCKRHTLLVVDDDESHRQLMMDLLTPIGFTLLTAENGHVALHLARQNHIDLLLLDVAMPEMSGWELLRQLRNKGQLAPVIMISAEADEGKCRHFTGEGKFATVKPLRFLYYWRTSVKYCISSGARNVSRQSSRKYMNHARSLPVSRLSR